MGYLETIGAITVLIGCFIFNGYLADKYALYERVATTFMMVVFGPLIIAGGITMLIFPILLVLYWIGFTDSFGIVIKIGEIAYYPLQFLLSLLPD